jgi:cytochrome b561
MLRNSPSRFGKITIAIHWISAIVIIGQFSFGLYMLSLDYYDPNYQILPHYHKSIGILFSGLLAIRIIWTLINPSPGPASGVKPWEHRAAKAGQVLMLGLLVVVVILGYLISTADGKSIDVFNWFEVPATITSIEDQEDIAGEWHYWLALSVIIIASIHALAALKHHFLSKDTTLLRMLGQ